MASQTAQSEELERLSRRFRPVLMAFFMRRLHSHAEAEDLSQEVFVRLARQGQSAMQSPEAFIFQVAANLLRDRYRREKVREQFRTGMATMDGRGVDPIDPLRIASDREALAMLRQAIKELPERMRTIFLLCRLENADRHVVADAYGVSVRTIDRELANALAILAEKVREGSAA